MCGAPLHHIPPWSYCSDAWAKRCDDRTSRSSPRRCADGTPPRSFAGLEPGERHRAERVPRTRRCRSNGAWIGWTGKTYDYFLYVASTLPLRSTRVCRQHSPLSLLCITMILRVRRNFFEITTFPNGISAATRRNLGGTNVELRQSCSAGETSLPEGEIVAIVITNAPLIGRGKSPSTSSPAPSPLKTLVHLLYPILVSKSGIGDSSVDYSL